MNTQYSINKKIARDTARSLCIYWKQFVATTKSDTGKEFIQWIKSVPNNKLLIEVTETDKISIHCLNCGVALDIWQDTAYCKCGRAYCTINCVKNFCTV